MLSMRLCSIPFTGNTGEPSFSSTPIIIYPPPRLSISFANAHIEWIIALGLKSLLNSILEDSTTRLFISSSILTWIALIIASSYTIPYYNTLLIRLYTSKTIMSSFSIKFRRVARHIFIELQFLSSNYDINCIVTACLLCNI